MRFGRMAAALEWGAACAAPIGASLAALATLQAGFALGRDGALFAGAAALGSAAFVAGVAAQALAGAERAPKPVSAPVDIGLGVQTDISPITLDQALAQLEPPVAEPLDALKRVLGRAVSYEEPVDQVFDALCRLETRDATALAFRLHYGATAHLNRFGWTS